MQDPTPIQDIETLLAAEKTALLSGDLSELDTIATAKEDLVTRLGQARLVSSDLSRLVALSHANAALLQAVMQAVKDTKSLLIQAQTAPETRSYNAEGARESLDTGPGRLAHKA